MYLIKYNGIIAHVMFTVFIKIKILFLREEVGITIQGYQPLFYTLL